MGKRSVSAGDAPGTIEEVVAELDELTGYSGSIQGTSIDRALDEQREALWRGLAALEMIALALDEHFGEAWPSNIPPFALALRSAMETIDDVPGALEAGVLEDRGIALARAHRVALEVSP